MNKRVIIYKQWIHRESFYCLPCRARRRTDATLRGRGVRCLCDPYL